MTETPPKGKTRSIEAEITINAPVEAVWKALTDADELTRWFPLDARVRPGKGGSIWLSWGPPVEGEARIEVWEPNRRFQSATASQPHSPPLVVDFQLEARGGKTLLRLVHSGFSADTDWDDQYDSTRTGWHFELRSLRHYLQNHRGTPRRVAWIRRPISISHQEAWDRLWGGEGLNGQDRLADFREGARYRLTAATGDLFEGVITTFLPPRNFGGTVENLQNSIFRILIENFGPQREASVWLSTWGVPAEQVEAFRQRWTAQLQKLFPESPAEHTKEK